MSEVPPEELAAAITAVEMLLAEEADPPALDMAERVGWRDSARLAAVHLPPARTAVRPSWDTVERLRRPPYIEP